MLFMHTAYDGQSAIDGSYAYVLLRSRLSPYLRMKVCCSDSSHAFFSFLLSALSCCWIDICSLKGVQTQLCSKRYPLRMRCEPGEDEKDEN